MSGVYTGGMQCAAGVCCRHHVACLVTIGCFKSRNAGLATRTIAKLMHNLPAAPVTECSKEPWRTHARIQGQRAIQLKVKQRS
jgi:hypothetical protein